MAEIRNMGEMHLWLWGMDAPVCAHEISLKMNDIDASLHPTIFRIIILWSAWRQLSSSKLIINVRLSPNKSQMKRKCFLCQQVMRILHVHTTYAY